MKAQEKIKQLRGPHYFLSNFYPAPVEIGGICYENNEAAFQAQKEPERAREFVHLPPNVAKQIGRPVELRPDWEQIKLETMADIVRAKFTQNENLRKKLLETGQAAIIEGNYWHDNFYGVCTCARCLNKPGKKGLNHLGRILMEIRRELSIK